MKTPRRSFGIVDDEPLSIYRDRTIAILRRYSRAAMQLGRLPSLLGREFFRSHVTSYGMHSFEDAVIFALDVERCLELLDCESRQWIARITFQEHTYEEAARVHGCNVRTVARRYPEAVDRLTEILLERGILAPIARHKKNVVRLEACQEGENVRFAASA